MKRCNRCKRELDLSCFGKNRSNKDGLMYQCRECNNKRVQEWQGKNPTRERPWYANRRYERLGLTKEQFFATLDSQGGVCAICKHSDSPLVIDHDHACCPGKNACGECFRGILCTRCNLALGIMEDSVDRLESAIKYLVLR
jgi:hypothetical protein